MGMQANVRAYYQQFEQQQTQSLIDQRIKYGSCLENKKLGVGFKFLSYRVFGGYGGGTEGVRDRFAVGGRRD